ncbi:MAG: copper resistance protein CopC [Candidatus Nanopelagicales bacterium]|nr:copper resistance protein CopC [Candidatus Nanopelagicales bacterium]
MRRGFARVLAVVLVGALAVAAGGPSASAHTQLVATSPSEGAVLTTSPASVSATFNESLLTTGGAMVVLDAERRSVGTGDARVQRATIALDLQPSLPDGTYRAAYRVISADGHPVEGSFTFIVGSPSKPEVQGTAPANAAGEQQSPAWPAIVLLAAALLGAVAVGWWVVRRVRE